MTEGADPTPSLADVLRQLEMVLQEPIDFAATDTEATLAKVRLLAAAATYFNTLAVADYGGRVGPAREPGLIEHAVGAAFQTFGGEDPHPGAFDKAAMLLRGIARDRPFADGNARTAFLVAAYYLRVCGHALPSELAVNQVIDLCRRVESGQLRDLGAIRAELRRLWEP